MKNCTVSKPSSNKTLLIFICHSQIVRFGRTVRAELLLFGLAQMTELFSADHRTFFLLYIAFFTLDVSSLSYVKSVIIGVL